MLSNRKSFTLVELAVVISIIGILAATTAGIVVSLTQLIVYLPREMRAKIIAHEIMETMIEGESQKRGMRYATVVKDASPIQFTYTFGYPGNTDKRNVRFEWDSAENKIYRSYTALGDVGDDPPPSYSSEEAIPYYARGDISVTGRASAPNTIFTYFKADGTLWTEGVDPLYNIKRIEININVKTGTGVFQFGESSFDATSGTEIRQYK